MASPMPRIYSMFYQIEDYFQSSRARYAPLSSVESGEGSLHTGSVTLQPSDSTEKAYKDEVTSIRGNRWHLTRFCPFAVGLLLGCVLSLLGSKYVQHLRNDEQTLSGTHTKQFVPQSKHIYSYTGVAMEKHTKPLQSVPTTTIIFSKKAALMDPPSDTNQRYWDALTPSGHGFVNVSHPEAYGLLPGIPTISGVDRYSVAMFHQLHCLVICFTGRFHVRNRANEQQGLLRHSYWRLIDGMSETWTDAMRQEEVRKQLGDRHTQHCFAYIAESIMCAGDLTIEWAKVERDGSRTQVDGWGVPHQCKDPEAMGAWMEANHGPAKDGHVHLHT